MSIALNSEDKQFPKIKQFIKKEKIEEKEQVQEALREEIEKILEISDNTLKLETKPSVILVIGVNGVGKTTSIGKMAARLARDGKKVVVAAADTFRAAAVEQLEIWAKKTDSFFYGKENSDPAGVIYDGLNEALKEKCDLIFIDTAGRLQNKVNLMKELIKSSLKSFRMPLTKLY